MTVTVTNTLRDGTVETSSAKSAVVTEDPVFVDAAGKPVTGGTGPGRRASRARATAGKAFSYTFRATGSPGTEARARLRLPDDVSDDSSDDGDDEGSPADQLPDGITFDAETGVLSGTSDEATDTEFAVDRDERLAPPSRSTSR